MEPCALDMTLQGSIHNFFGGVGDGGNLLFLSCNFINLGTWQAESMSNFCVYQVHYQCFLIEHLGYIEIVF